jgi:hypothetical protein
MTTHTKGPWKVTPKGDVAYHSTHEDQSYGMWIELANVYGENMESDACLIAAAPDLLDAVRAQHDIIDRLLAMLITADPTFRPTKSEIWDLIKTVSAPQLIAKATGTA